LVREVRGQNRRDFLESSVTVVDVFHTELAREVACVEPQDEFSKVRPERWGPMVAVVAVVRDRREQPLGIDHDNPPTLGEALDPYVGEFVTTDPIVVFL